MSSVSFIIEKVIIKVVSKYRISLIFDNFWTFLEPFHMYSQLQKFTHHSISEKD